MRKIIIIFFAVSICGLLLGYAVDWRSYIGNFSNLPNFFDILADVKVELEKVPDSFNKLNSIQVNNINDFFYAVGQFFQSVGLTFWAILQILVVMPTRIILFVFRVLFAIIPWSSIKGVEVPVL